MTHEHYAGGSPEHRHEHDARDQAHGEGHPHAHGRLGRLQAALPFGHGHRHGAAPVDGVLESSARGIWALKVSLVGLGATAVFQLVIVLISGSVALLTDTIHNVADALTAVPLWIAFALARRPASRRFTYGYGRAEDVAGVVIVAVIAASAALAAYESGRKLLNPEPLDNLGWVMGAALIGFLGNEAVALLRIRVGREIGSAALVADGQHARVDGLTSLAVLLGALGVLAGFPIADPLVGLLITLAILVIVKDTAITMWHRLMDAVEPELLDGLEQAAFAVPGADGVHDVRARWVGHKLHAELHVTVDEDLPTRVSHELAEAVRLALMVAQPRLAAVTVHIDPCGHGERRADGDTGTEEPAA